MSKFPITEKINEINFMFTRIKNRKLTNLGFKAAKILTKLAKNSSEEKYSDQKENLSQNINYFMENIEDIEQMFDALDNEDFYYLMDEFFKYIIADPGGNLFENYDTFFENKPLKLQVEIVFKAIDIYLKDFLF